MHTTEVENALSDLYNAGEINVVRNRTREMGMVLFIDAPADMRRDHLLMRLRELPLREPALVDFGNGTQEWILARTD